MEISAKVLHIAVILIFKNVELCSEQTGLNVTECFRLVMEKLAELKPKEFQDSIITPFEEPPKRKTCVVS